MEKILETRRYFTVPLFLANASISRKKSVMAVAKMKPMMKLNEASKSQF